MKIDAMTAGALGFAAFAIYYVLKPKTPVADTSQAQQIYAASKTQRREVGASLGQNYSFLGDYGSTNFGNVYALPTLFSANQK